MIRLPNHKFTNGIGEMNIERKTTRQFDRGTLRVRERVRERKKERERDSEREGEREREG